VVRKGVGLMWAAPILMRFGFESILTRKQKCAKIISEARKEEESPLPSKVPFNPS